jgi:hypothetical protein
MKTSVIPPFPHSHGKRFVCVAKEKCSVLHLLGQHWLARPPLGKKSIESDHEIMQNGIICLNWVEKM